MLIQLGRQCRAEDVEEEREEEEEEKQPPGGSIIPRAKSRKPGQILVSIDPLESLPLSLFLPLSRPLFLPPNEILSRVGTDEKQRRHAV